MDEETVTLKSQFVEFAKMMDKTRNGSSIALSHSDYWMRQAKILDDRQLTMVDTGNTFYSKFKQKLQQYKSKGQKYWNIDGSEVKKVKKNVITKVLLRIKNALLHRPKIPEKFEGNFKPKTELSYNEWLGYLEDVCKKKDLDLEQVKDALKNCGLPGEGKGEPPQYRDKLEDSKSQDKTIIQIK